MRSGCSVLALPMAKSERERLLAINPGGSRPALPGVSVTDPAYGLPAVWIEESARQNAKTAGYTVVDAGMVFITHLTEVLKQHAHNLRHARKRKSS